MHLILYIVRRGGIVSTGCACKHRETEVVGAVHGDDLHGRRALPEVRKTIQNGKAIPTTGRTAGKLTDVQALLELVKDPISAKVTHKVHVYHQNIGDASNAGIACRDEILPCKGEAKCDPKKGATYYKVNYNGDDDCWINAQWGELLCE